LACRGVYKLSCSGGVTNNDEVKIPSSSPPSPSSKGKEDEEGEDGDDDNDDDDEGLYPDNTNFE